MFALAERPAQVHVSDIPWLICVNTAKSELEETTPEEKQAKSSLDSEQLEYVAKSLSFQYRYNSATRTPSKMTATQLKGREKDDVFAKGLAE